MTRQHCPNCDDGYHTPPGVAPCPRCEPAQADQLDGYCDGCGERECVCADTRMIPCEACNGEGRIIRRTVGYEPGCGHPHNYGERDDGECPDCLGTREIEVELVA